MKIILVILETFYNSVIYRTRSIKMYLALQNKKGNKELGGLKKKKEKKTRGGRKKLLRSTLWLPACVQIAYILHNWLIDIGKFCDVLQLGILDREILEIYEENKKYTELGRCSVLCKLIFVKEKRRKAETFNTEKIKIRCCRDSRDCPNDRWSAWK